MKALIVSDTHGNTKNLQKAIDFADKSDIELIIHLGDDYEDCDSVAIPDGVELIRVPGIYSPLYSNTNVPNRIIKEIDGIKLLITHTHEALGYDIEGDINPEKIIEKGEVDIVLHGHTHVPGMIEMKGVILLNPGHLKNEDKKGYPPTYMIIDFKDRKAVIYKLEDESIFKEISF